MISILLSILSSPILLLYWAQAGTYLAVARIAWQAGHVSMAALHVISALLYALFGIVDATK